ncbi:MAG: sigma-54 dependent transcriptional regulator, partial [Desulfobacterales bacterium]|nr:sigma-54 dependent transcriptional regulator [Desulfobacterales bacterium]
MKSITDNSSILIVDDDEGLLLSIKAWLLSAGMPEPALISDSKNAMEVIRDNSFHLILLDLVMPHVTGLELLKQIKEEYPDIECIVVTAIDEASSAVQAISMGAYDYLVKPINSEKLIITINRGLERYNLKHELNLFSRKQSFSTLKDPDAFNKMIAEDEAMARVFLQVEAVAPTDYSVVINGESGTGKELLARTIHNLSNRSTAPFFAVNMASFTKTIFEDEFFGHTKGAYTDAISEKRGFFEEAHGGTLFLDEITDLDPSLQGKILRAIEERELYRLGSTTVRNVDVRIIAASNKNIGEEIEKGCFRADLFYRLDMYHIEIPPLRERKNDILPLARHFLNIHAGSNKKKIDSIGLDLAESLLEYPFPGNVRELENIITAAVLIEKSNKLTLSSAQTLTPASRQAVNNSQKFPTLAELEKYHIQQALQKADGNRAQAAKILGI